MCASLPTFRQLIMRTFPLLLPPSVRKAYGHRSEKQYHDPGMLWEPFRGPGGYSADISVSNDRDSASHHGEGIQVVRELRWEMGSAEGGSDNSNAVPEANNERSQDENASAV